MNDKKYILLAIISSIGLLMASSAALYAQPTSDAQIVNTGGAEPAEANLDAGMVATAEPRPGLATATAKDALGTAGEVLSDVRGGDWRHAAAGLLTLIMLGLARARDKTDWFSGDRAGAALVLGIGFLGALATSLYGSAPIDWRFFVGALGVVTSSAGAYTIAKKLIFPKDKSTK